MYKNHMNEIVEFGKNGIYANIGDLRNYTWDVTTKNNRVSAFTRKVGTRQLPVVIMCSTAEECTQAKNKLFETIEKDVLAKQCGKLYLGNYYMRCYITGSSKSDYLDNGRCVKLSLTIATDTPYWIKETTVSSAASSEVVETGLDYLYDFPYDFTSALANLSINNTGIIPANFRLVIFGACINPAITVGDHIYQVNCTVDSGEYLTIDSVSKTILVAKNNGVTVNQFKNRNKSSYIFEKIPSGVSSIAWNGAFGFDLTLLEERSEPKWT